MRRLIIVLFSTYLLVALLTGCQSDSSFKEKEADLYFDIGYIEYYLQEIGYDIESDLEESNYEELDSEIVEKHIKNIDRGLEVVNRLKPTKYLKSKTTDYQEEVVSYLEDLKTVIKDPSKVDILDEHDEYHTIKENLLGSFKYYEID